MLASERGKESPMDLDSPPSVWCNSPVPTTSPDKPITPPVDRIPPQSQCPELDGLGCSEARPPDLGAVHWHDEAEWKVTPPSQRQTRRYLQVAFNVILISGVLYFLMQFFLTVRRDVQIKVDEQLSAILGEISQCSKQYVENRCSPDLRVPAMEKACIMWESCMKRDPSVIGRAKLSAETFAEIINGFIEPISYKTMVPPSGLVVVDIVDIHLGGTVWNNIPVKLCLFNGKE